MNSTAVHFIVYSWWYNSSSLHFRPLSRNIVLLTSVNIVFKIFVLNINKLFRTSYLWLTQFYLFPLQVIQSEGLEKYVDARYLQDQISEATGLSREEMDAAAHKILTSRAVFDSYAPKPI